MTNKWMAGVAGLLLLATGCATVRERKALRLQAEQSLQVAEFEVSAATSPDVMRYSRGTLSNAQLALRRAHEEFARKKYVEASQWADSAKKGAALAVKETKAAKEKEAATVPTKKPAPAKKKSPAGR